MCVNSGALIVLVLHLDHAVDLVPDELEPGLEVVRERGADGLTGGHLGLALAEGGGDAGVPGVEHEVDGHLEYGHSKFSYCKVTYGRKSNVKGGIRKFSIRGLRSDFMR